MGTTVLKNRLGLRVQKQLDAFEAEATAQRFLEPLPIGRFTPAHYCAVHRHLFGDVYPWAGRYRRVRITKDTSTFCYPEFIKPEMQKTFQNLQQNHYFCQLSLTHFTQQAAHFLAQLNAIHAFRDGNGRTQLAFMALLAHHAGHPLNFAKLQPQPFLAAMVASFHGQENLLANHLKRMCT